MIKSKRITRTDEELKLEALKFSSRNDFQNKSNPAYKQAWRKGIFFLNSICSHMENKWEEKWKTLESVQKEALKYKTRTSFARGSSGAYDKAQREGWLIEVCFHMGENPNLPYKFEEIFLAAKKYTARSAFRKNEPGVWLAAYRSGRYNEICSHMGKCGDVSLKEQELMDFVKKIFISAKTLKDRKIKIIGKPWVKGFDIDIFIPELKLGIEFDGEYWHSFNSLKKRLEKWPDEDILNYHEIKDSWFATKGIEVLHIKEKEWDSNKEDCIKKCLNFLESRKISSEVK